MSRRHLHPDIDRFCSELQHAVDFFHFTKNHIGVWCDLMVNPYSVDALTKGGGNTNVCEQRFRHINKFRSMLRAMKRERFNWTLLSITEADHQFRRQELL